jgi:hypothetical protein
MSRIRRVATLVLRVVREIFDEAAYARFLQRQGLRESRDSYAAFLEEQQMTKGRRVKCC